MKIGVHVLYTKDAFCILLSCYSSDILWTTHNWIKVMENDINLKKSQPFWDLKVKMMLKGIVDTRN